MKAVHPGGVVLRRGLIASGIALQFAFAYYLDWLPSIGWGGKPKAVTSPRPSAALPAPG